jgi:hypothetical protein
MVASKLQSKLDLKNIIFKLLWAENIIIFTVGKNSSLGYGRALHLILVYIEPLYIHPQSWIARQGGTWARLCFETKRREEELSISCCVGAAMSRAATGGAKKQGAKLPANERRREQVRGTSKSGEERRG